MASRRYRLVAIDLLSIIAGLLGAFALAGIRAGFFGEGVASLGFIRLPAVAIIIPTTIDLAPVGAQLADTAGPAWNKMAFAVFFGLTALRMLRSAI